MSRTLTLALLTCLAGCVSADAERWRLYNEIGIQAYAEKDYPHALECFDLALSHHAQDPVLVFNVAQCYDRLGDVKKAEQFYAYAIQLNTKLGDAHLAQIELYWRTGRADVAKQKIDDWLKQEPKSPEPYIADAWRLRQEKAYPLAQLRLEQALSIDLNNRRALTELGLLYEIEGMPDKALVMYERILELDKNQTEIADRLAKLKAAGVNRPLPN